MTAFAFLGFAAFAALAQDKPAAHAAQGAESFEVVKKEYRDAVKIHETEYGAAYDEAKKNGKTKGFKFDKPSPALRFSPRFLAIAEQNPEGPDAIDALSMTFRPSSPQEAI